MCDSCGCGDPSVVPFEVQERILAGNEKVAAHNREHFRQAGVLAINLMGSPGSGKTSVLEVTARGLRQEMRIGAVSGDLATSRDADRLAAGGGPSAAITTGTACHLDAELVHRTLHDFPWQDLQVLFIENVGNLVFPAVYDLGHPVNGPPSSRTRGR